MELMWIIICVIGWAIGSVLAFIEIRNKYWWDCSQPFLDVFASIIIGMIFPIVIVAFIVRRIMKYC